MYAKKQFGQNFLISEKVRRDIIEAGNVSQTDTILEIGPGEGFLTDVLLKKAGHVIAIEKDRDLIPPLQVHFDTMIREKKLHLIEADIRDVFDTAVPQNPYKLIANIPYYITGELLRIFLSSDNQPTHIVFLVQKEVAERIIARDGKESILSLSVKVYGEPCFVSKVPPGCFRPMPTIDSAILRIESISKDFFKKTNTSDAISENDFFTLIRAGFSQKRKQLAGNLASLINPEQLRIFLREITINPLIRAEDLSLSQWKQIVHFYQENKL